MEFTVRRARTSDVRAIRMLVDANADSGHLLGKDTVTLYEDVPEFWVAEEDPDGVIAGCGALHVMWEDLAEIRTIAVADSCQGNGVGQAIVEALLAAARQLGVRRVFVLTFATTFFERRGFREIKGPRYRRRCTPNFCAPTTRALPNSSTSTASSPIRSLTRACSSTWMRHARDLARAACRAPHAAAAAFA